VKPQIVQLLIVWAATVRGYGERQILVLLAQSALETGNWKAQNWWNDKNPFGMSEMSNAKRRQRLRGVRLGPDGLYRAQFKTLLGGVQDRLDWDKQMGISPTSDEYLQEVSKVYHTSDAYADTVGNRIDGAIYRAYWIGIASMPVMALIVLKWLQNF
jgi:hypothetical protein